MEGGEDRGSREDRGRWERKQRKDEKVVMKEQEGCRKKRGNRVYAISICGAVAVIPKACSELDKTPGWW